MGTLVIVVLSMRFSRVHVINADQVTIKSAEVTIPKRSVAGIPEEDTLFFYNITSQSSSSNWYFAWSKPNRIDIRIDFKNGQSHLAYFTADEIVKKRWPMTIIVTRERVWLED